MATSSGLPRSPKTLASRLKAKRVRSGRESTKSLTSAESSLTFAPSIITRYNRVYGDPKKLLTLHSLVIQSPLLKEVLEDVLAGYPGVAVELKLLKFDGL